VVNYLEKIFCVEILEKILRMKRFLLSEPDITLRRGSEVTNVFLKALNAIAVTLGPVIHRLSDDTVLGEWERIAAIRRLSDIFRSVDRLHLYLQFIYGSWVRPETHVFIKSVLEFLPKERRPEKVNVILSNLYSFLETDLSSYIEEILRPSDIRLDLQTASPSIFLPKIERDNPLNWSILVHECGHIDSMDLSSIPELQGLFPDGMDAAAGEILRNWAEEIYCDLFAAKILGPAYLSSFVTFSLVVAAAGGSELLTETHPPDIVRISIVQEVLKKSGLEVRLRVNQLGSGDLTTLFFGLLEERTKVDRRYFNQSSQQRFPQLVLGEFVDIICEQVDKIISLSQDLTIKNFSRISYLAERLSKGILIGSYQEPEAIERGKKEYLAGRLDREQLEDAKKTINESRVLLWEIVNAGWVHKVEGLYPKAFELFFSGKDRSLEEKMLEWGNEIENIDRLLLKSIEASEIHRLFEGE
jgi:hypothetical protein